MFDEDTFDFLRPKNARTSQFYIFPKIYKPNILGRTIVLSCGAPLENIILQRPPFRSLVKNIPSYIKDTNDLFLKLQEINELTP